MVMESISMADKIQANIDLIIPASFAGDSSYDEVIEKRREYLEAFCQGIIDELVENAVITTTSGAPDGEHIGIIE